MADAAAAAAAEAIPSDGTKGSKRCTLAGDVWRGVGRTAARLASVYVKWAIQESRSLQSHRIHCCCYSMKSHWVGGGGASP